MKSDDADDSEKLLQSRKGVLNISDVANKEEVTRLEDISKNKSRESSFKTYFESGANFYALTTMAALFLLSQILASGCDYWVAFW